MAEGPPKLDRRAALGYAVLGAAVIGTPVAVLTAMRNGERGEASDRQRMMLAQVAQLVIPRTDTPGAGDTGAHEFVILALQHGLDGTLAPAIGGANTRFRRDDGTLDHLGWLEHALDTRANGDFAGAQTARQQAALSHLDGEAFAKGAPDSPWKKIKGLILTGYYTSEAGGSKELRYELVPGHWDADLAARPGERAWSSDWTAVEFS